MTYGVCYQANLIPKPLKQSPQHHARLFSFVYGRELLNESEKKNFSQISEDMDDTTATLAIHRMPNYLYRYYGKKVIILLDEYDMPMQEAYVKGFWDELTFF